MKKYKQIIHSLFIVFCFRIFIPLLHGEEGGVGSLFFSEYVMTAEEMTVTMKGAFPFNVNNTFWPPRKSTPLEKIVIKNTDTVLFAEHHISFRIIPFLDENSTIWVLKEHKVFYSIDGTETISFRGFRAEKSGKISPLSDGELIELVENPLGLPPEINFPIEKIIWNGTEIKVLFNGRNVTTNEWFAAQQNSRRPGAPAKPKPPALGKSPAKTTASSVRPPASPPQDSLPEPFVLKDPPQPPAPELPDKPLPSTSLQTSSQSGLTEKSFIFYSLLALLFCVTAGIFVIKAKIKKSP
jgi:hypothetical protein